jgi:reverse gyrase
MNWKKERDLLIAQTMAFVQSVTGKKPDLERASDTGADVAEPFIQATQILQAPVEAIKIGATDIVEPPRDIKDIQIPRAIAPGDVRSEMQARVANFRAHQERFNRERDEYFSATLTKLRASIGNNSAPDPSDRAPRDR